MNNFNDRQFQAIDRTLVGITKELNNLENIDNSEKSQKETCFLMWCW